LICVGAGAERASTPIALQPREFRLLEFWCVIRVGGDSDHTARISWDYHFDPQNNAVEVQISRLRQTIDRDFSPPLRHTVRDVGYMISADG
jgi:two-component system, OmpR family, response regulator